jgi:two-component system, LytTR family, response regulator
MNDLASLVSGSIPSKSDDGDSGAQSSRTNPQIAPPTVTTVYVGAVIAMTALYTVIFVVTMGVGWVSSLSTALANVIPLAGISAATYLVLHQAVLPRGVWAQAGWHVALAPVFAVSWYALALVALMLLRAIETGVMRMSTFSSVALVWQIFQGLILYALVAASAYALRGGRQGATVQIVTGQSMQRYLTRQGDELVPIAVDEIVLITGAQDYAEVTTLDRRRHLVRLSLGEFEKRLPTDEFVRIHRSTIVNLRHLDRAEPAGSGRMTLHLCSGDTVEASRAGTRALRDRVL